MARCFDHALHELQRRERWIDELQQLSVAP